MAGVSNILPFAGLFTRKDAAPGPRPVGIIDIGSNSVRLVVYNGLNRVPVTMFNEKVMAGLGRGLASNGELSNGAMDVAVGALRRFSALSNAMQLESLRVVATAAVREASNAKDFLARVQAECGLEIQIISGAEEARGAALGVLSGIPLADGVVGDLGGGSLELVRIKDGETHQQISLPIGALRLEAIHNSNSRALAPFIKKALNKIDWAESAKDLPFYMVGGSWRALAQVHMHMHEYPLPIVHQYQMPATAAASLVRTLARIAPAQLKIIPNLSTSRLPALPGAAMLLAATLKRLGASHAVASGFGLREGLLYEQLPPEIRSQDPLIEATRAEGARQGRFPEHGDMLFAWMDGLFIATESPTERRLRLAACLLSDVAWRAHPDFRAERGVDTALHGNWIAVSGQERAAIACALHFCFGGRADAPITNVFTDLAPAELLANARTWGLALRLGQRLTAGTATALATSSLTQQDGKLSLRLEQPALLGDAVQRRLKYLASAMDLEAITLEG